MLYRLAADFVVVVHALFVVFVVIGGLAVLRWPRVAWAHLPAAIWGALIEFAGWICPLTPLEKWLRVRAGGVAYEGGFIQHYLLPILYPPGLTRGTQVVLGLVVLVINLAVYGLLLRRLAAPRR
ncbi:MAG: DUF2784 domain-containing protein [Thermoanaerobaculia bacterium]